MPPPSADKILHLLRAMPPQGKEKLPEIARELKDIPLGIVLEQIKVEVLRIFSIGEKELEDIIRVQVKEEEGWNLFPPDGYFRDYLEFTRRSRAPILYHATCSLIGVGAVIRDTVYTRWEDIRFYPNISTFFLGGSGVGKTLSTGKLVRILKKIEGEIPLVLEPEQMTPESMLGELVTNPTGMVYFPEFAASAGKQDYMRGMITQITRLLDYHDTPYVRRLKSSSVTIPNPAPSFCVCTNIDFLRSSAPREAFGGGFWARFLPVFSEDTLREPEPFPELSIEELCLQTRLINTLTDLKTFLGGEIIWTPPAKELYTEWFKEDALGEEAKFRQADPLLGPYFKRRHAFARKLAICFHIMLCRDLHLCAPCLSLGLKFLDWSDSFLSVLIHQTTRSEVGEEIGYILQLIRKEQDGTIEHSSLIRKTQHRLKAKEVREILQGLIESGQVKVGVGGGGGRWYKLL